MITSESLILQKPRLSEKSTHLKSQNQYIFDVEIGANKDTIKKAVEKQYHVKVVKIRTLRIPAKPKTWRGKKSHHQEQKKAIVFLKEGQAIELGA